MGCLTAIAKYLLFLFNFLIVICGIALIAIGAILVVDENKGVESFTEYSVGGFAIAVGVIIFLIAFFGCCGAIKENGCMLLTYAIVLIVLLILQIVLGAMAFVALKNDDGALDKKVQEIVQKVFDKYYSGNKDDKDVVDNFQQDFECCGVINPLYWGINPPPSCYKNREKSIQNLYKEGCAGQFKDAIVSNIKIVGGVAIAFAVVEFVGAVFAFMVRSRK